MVGVTLTLKGTAFGVATDMEGRYILSGLPSGSFRLVASYIGFTTKTVSVTLTDSLDLSLDIPLRAHALNLSEVLVEADRPYSAASSRSIRKFDLDLRPNRSAQDMLQLTPGLFIAQHAGGGKAEQIFLRGFDADHGTDVALFVDDIPVNMVSHGHGQGYADLHFHIPEVVEEINVYKGPYFARFGNLSAAGAVEFRTREHLEKNVLHVEGGAFNTRKITALLQIPNPGPHQNM
ncbi:MAG: TonB-dependent receptor [candidate division Zixibacteria bacterium]|nr:TonB-dependent receptor [candidate division Zixibacteria bacterium]